jgi:hypothetical protein
MKKKWGIIMPKLLGTEELKNILNFEYSKNTVLKIQRCIENLT